MMLKPIVRLSLIPNLCLKQIRNIRPTIKIGKDKFQLKINVHQFCKEEIRVKARPEYVVIEGKQERKTKRGYVVRQFARKFKLPTGVDPQNIKSTLTPDGVLTVTAPRETCDINLPCETSVPISFTCEKAADESIVEVQTKLDVCKNLLDEAKKSEEKKKKK